MLLFNFIMNLKNQYFIVDMGTATARIGYGGEEKPKYSIPSYVGVATNVMQEEDFLEKGIIGENLSGPLPDIEIKHIYDSGNVVNFDAYETLLATILPFELSLRPQQTTLILTQDNLAERSQRQKLCNIAFEKLRFKSILFSKIATLSAFSVGRTTGVILDSGQALTTATIVHDGFTFGKSSKRSEYAGRTLTKEVRRYVEQVLKVKVTPSVGLKSNKLTPSFYQYHLMDLYRQIKESVFGQTEGKSESFKDYILPDRQVIRINKQEIPNIFLGGYNNDLNYQGVPHLVNQVISQSELEIKLKLYENVIAVGGNTYVQGFVSSVEKELGALSPVQVRPRILSTPRRRQSCWLGASILSSISSLQPFCISRHDFKQYGITILDKKCP